MLIKRAYRICRPEELEDEIKLSKIVMKQMREEINAIKAS